MQASQAENIENERQYVNMQEGGKHRKKAKPTETY